MPNADTTMPPENRTQAAIERPPTHVKPASASKHEGKGIDNPVDDAGQHDGCRPLGSVARNGGAKEVAADHSERREVAERGR